MSIEYHLAADADGDDMECEVCDTVAPLAFFEDRFSGDKWQCQLCAGSLLGNIAKRSGEQQDLAKGIIQALHIIRNDIKDQA